LRARIKALEDRVRKLEDALARQPSINFGPGNGGWHFNNMDRELRRSLEEALRGLWPGGDAWQDVQQPDVGNKPRLGVMLAEPSDELRERFKNDVREGAFVTEIVPGSPAENAGLNVGDCITSFNNKDIKTPADLIDTVRAAPQGKSDIIVTRRGEAIKLQVELGEPQAGAKAEAEAGPRGWLWNKDEAPESRTRSRIEVKASALEMNDELAKDLKLTDEQKKKMGDVLAKHNQALNREAAAEGFGAADSRARGGGFGGADSRARGWGRISLSSDTQRLVDKHVAEAEKELAGTLSAQQLKRWAEYRKQHSTISATHEMKIESGNAPAEGGGGETMNF
jgi:hypothetical protein